MAGFGSPVALLAGFIFGKWLGTFIVVFGMQSVQHFIHYWKLFF